jgi:hypothetical protein
LWFLISKLISPFFLSSLVFSSSHMPLHKTHHLYMSLLLLMSNKGKLYVYYLGKLKTNRTLYGFSDRFKIHLYLIWILLFNNYHCDLITLMVDNCDWVIIYPTHQKSPHQWRNGRNGW